MSGNERKGCSPIARLSQFFSGGEGTGSPTGLNENSVSNSSNPSREEVEAFFDNPATAAEEWEKVRKLMEEEKKNK